MVQGKEERRLIIFSLGELISADNAEEDIQRLTELLSSFSCPQDKDIEDFLHNRAVDFERINKARTYFLCDENALQTEGKFVILGYFSISLKVLELSDSLSNRKRKMLDGLSSKLHGKVINSIPCYLIGQLAKNSNIPDELSVNGADLINCAISIIHSAETLVGGRYVLIECHDNPKLLDFTQATVSRCLINSHLKMCQWFKCSERFVVPLFSRSPHLKNLEIFSLQFS